LNRAVERDLENICLKCLEKSPLQRYSSAEALADDLERWLRHEPIRAKRAGPVARLQRWVRRNPVGAALIATLLLGLSATLALLQMVTTARDTAEQQRGLLTTDAEMEAFWGRSSSSSSMEWPSEKLRAIVSLPSRPPLAPGGRRYRMGILVEEKPKNRLHGYAPFLAYLEEKLDPRSNRLDFVTYKRNEFAIKDLVKGDLDFLRIGGLSYLEAKSNSPAIMAIVSQAPAKSGIIFTRIDSTLTNLTDLKGRSFAFGDPYATISFWAKYHLAQAGITGTDLRYEMFNSIDAFERSMRKGTPNLGPSERLNSHMEAIKKVTAGEFDAGVSSAKQIRELLDKHQVRKLAEFKSTSLFWLAGGDLPQDVVQRFQRAMLELHDQKMLEGIGGQKTRFERVSPKELQELERATAIVNENFPPPSGSGPKGGQE
jgi:ABC-type phosphate/phosphonate transport system substrate-binding protein